MDEPASAPVVSERRKWGSLIVLSLALAIIIIDTTLLNVSLSTIIKDLHTDLQKIQWVITAYSLMLAAFTITGGRMGDLFGRKRMFMLGAVLFAVGSLTASNSHSFSTLLIGESIIEGIGAALMMPATSSLLVATFHGRERAIAFGVWGAIAAASSAIGPILGGWLTTNYSWRWGFRINVVVVAILLLSSFLIAESRERGKKLTLDWVGVILSSLGMLGIVFGFIESTTYGWWTAKSNFITFGHSITFGTLSVTPISIALGIIFLALFAAWELWREERGLTPLVSMIMLENPAFVSGTITTAVISLGQMGILFTFPVFMQSVLGLDAFHTGLAFIPLSLAILIVSPSMAALSHRIAPKRIIQAGLLLSFCATLVLRWSLNPAGSVWQLTPGFALFGAGMGMVMSQINNITLSAVNAQQAGEASGVNNTMRQLGSTLGAAIIGAVLLSSIPANITKQINLSGAIPNQAKAAITQSITKQGANAEFGGGAQAADPRTPVVIREAITTAVHQGTADANAAALLYAAVFSLLGLAVSTYLPSKVGVHGAPSSGH